MRPLSYLFSAVVLAVTALPAISADVAVGAKRADYYAGDMVYRLDTRSVSTVSAAAPIETRKAWVVTPGVSLRDTLSNWAALYGWGLSWEPAQDFVLLAGAEFNGEFDVAVSGLLAAVNARGYDFRAETYAGNKVLRVFEPGSER